MSELQPGQDSPPTVILGDDDAVFLRWAGYYALDGAFVLRHALLAEQGHLLAEEPGPGDAIDPDREAIRPDRTDVARFWDWLGDPEQLLGRVYFRDSRRGVPLTIDQIRKGLAELLARRWFTPEAYSVYMLRWLENLCVHAERRGLLADDSLAALRRDRWMVQGLRPSEELGAVRRSATFADETRAIAREQFLEHGRCLLLVRAGSTDKFLRGYTEDVSQLLEGVPDGDVLVRAADQALKESDPEREAILFEALPGESRLYLLTPGEVILLGRALNRKPSWIQRPLTVHEDDRSGREASPATKLDEGYLSRFVRWVPEACLNGAIVKIQAALAEAGGLHTRETKDDTWATFRPEGADLARIEEWAADPGLLNGRVFYLDSRRGTALTEEQIRKGIADMLARTWFTAEGLSVYALRWLECLVAFLEERRLLAPIADAAPLAAIRRDRWMVDGLPPDPRAAEKFGVHTPTAHIRARAMDTAGKEGRGIVLLDQRDDPVFIYMSLRDLQDNWGPDPDREGLLTHCERLLASYDPAREAVVLERREDRDWLYVLPPLGPDPFTAAP